MTRTGVYTRKTKELKFAFADHGYVCELNFRRKEGTANQAEVRRYFSTGNRFTVSLLVQRFTTRTSAVMGHQMLHSSCHQHLIDRRPDDNKCYKTKQTSLQSLLPYPAFCSVVPEKFHLHITPTRNFKGPHSGVPPPPLHQN